MGLSLSSSFCTLACVSIFGCGSFGTNTDPTLSTGSDAGSTTDSSATTTDSGGAASCPGNLIRNPDFEKSFDGWRVINGASVNLLPVPGHTGQAGRGCMKSGPYLSIMDDPATVIGAKQASTYRLRAWLRADGVMQRPLVANLRERQSSTGTIIQRASKAIDPVTSWTEVTVERTVTGDGSQLEIYFSIDDAPPALSCMEVDDLCLQLIP
jgi:hypothetical protein